jgi:hypothetical protein
MEINQADLPPSEREVFVAWETLFRSPGWVFFLRRYGPRLDGNTNDLHSAEDLRTLGRAQGSRDLLMELTQLETVIESEFRSMIAEAQAERRDVEDSGWRG